MRELNRIELLAETLRAALNTITVVAPDWLRVLTPSEWHERYGRPIEEMRLPETGPKRDAYVVQVGTDGYWLLDAVTADDAPEKVATLPVVALPQCVWARHFEWDKGGPDGKAPPKVQLRPVKGRGPGDRIESPYDVDAR